AALFGRKINTCEHQLTFVKYLRGIADAQLKSADAVKSYHADLEKLKIKPSRALKEDLAATSTASAYSGSASNAKPTKPSPVAARTVIPAPIAPPLKPDGSPDFKKMTSAQKVAY